jgi:hypothetical protein
MNGVVERLKAPTLSNQRYIDGKLPKEGAVTRYLKFTVPRRPRHDVCRSGARAVELSVAVRVQMLNTWNHSKRLQYLSTGR